MPRGLVLLLVGVVTASSAGAQRQDARGRDSVADAAAALLNEGRGNEARIELLRAMRASTMPTQKATYRLELGDTYLFDGQYGEAARAYNLVLHGDEAITVDTLVQWAHHGLALVDAFNGRSSRAAAHFAQALKGPSSLADTIEMLVITSQHDSALKALDRFAAAHNSEPAKQFTQAFRGLSWMMAGHCTQALPEIAKAPRQDRPVPLAVRGRCASKHGQRVEALAIRDSVMKVRVPDPFAWYVLIARDAARKIE
jgi:tetratricopeptide (TPR) repeat protein